MSERRRRKRHGPEVIVRKLRDADAMLNAGKDLRAGQSLFVGRWGFPFRLPPRKPSF
jgi:hypothetical protein